MRKICSCLALYAAAFAATAFLSTSAFAELAEQGRCGARGELTQALEKGYSEVPIAVGLIDGKTVIEVYARADGDSWTIVTSRADGMSCIIGAGKSWHTLPPKAVGEDS